MKASPLIPFGRVNVAVPVPPVSPAIVGEPVGAKRQRHQPSVGERRDTAEPAVIPQRHAEVVKLVADWLGSSLSPDVEDLFARSPYSPRQLQRLVDRYYGLTPKQ